MKIDLSQKQQLSDEERRDIATILQHASLIELFKHTRWNAEQIAFHGGTSMRIAWGSPRWSEDLDFMLNEDLWRAALATVIDKTTEGVRTRIMRDLPGSEISVKPPKNRHEEARNATYVLKWAHPMRQGVVRVKLEFFSTRPDLISQYKKASAIPSGDLMCLKTDRPIPVGDITSIWCDKIVACAFRPYAKRRDYFDLWYIQHQFARKSKFIDDLSAMEMLGTVAEIYGKNLTEVREGLDSALERPELVDVRALAEEMERWLSNDSHEAMHAHGTFEEILETAKNEIERAQDLIQQHTHPGPGGS